MTPGTGRELGLSIASLFAGATTLVCCALPAALVALGAGGAVVGLVAAVPQLVWLSERKGAVFGLAAVMVLASAAVLWQTRNRPCPADPALAAACRRLRGWSVAACAVAAVMLATGALVAYGLPLLAA